MFNVMYTLYGCAIVVLFSGLFLVMGSVLLSRLNLNMDNAYCNVASSFFTGMAVWLAALRTCSYFLLSYKGSFYFTLIVFIVVVVLTLKRRDIVMGGGNYIFSFLYCGWALSCFA